MTSPVRDGCVSVIETGLGSQRPSLVREARPIYPDEIIERIASRVLPPKVVSSAQRWWHPKGGQRKSAGSREVIEWRAGNSEWKREAVLLVEESGWQVTRA